MTETPEMASETTTQGTVATLPGAAGQRFAEHVAARYKSGGEWQELSFAQVKDAVDEIALGLVALGIAAGDRVAILADTRLEWTLTSYAISAAGAVVVPVYPTNSPKECAWVLGNSGASAVFCESEAQRAKIDQVRDELPDLRPRSGSKRAPASRASSSCASAAATATAQSSRRVRPPWSARIPTRSSTRRERPGRPRAWS
jgi:long-subunit acyl-CoA synthetase (AMP-forming)